MAPHPFWNADCDVPGGSTSTIRTLAITAFYGRGVSRKCRGRLFIVSFVSAAAVDIRDAMVEGRAVPGRDPPMTFAGLGRALVAIIESPAATAGSIDSGEIEGINVADKEQGAVPLEIGSAIQEAPSTGGLP
jgi:hypothetical protein